MKNIFLFAALFLTITITAFAQSPLSEFDKVKEIKLLESTREDVKKILAGYEHDADEDEDYEQYFSTEKAEIIVTFSKGDCSDDSSYWNVSQWTATKIRIKPEDTLKSENFDFSNFTKEIEDEESPEFYTYHDEKAGIAFEISEGEVQKIVFFPPDSKKGFLCGNEITLEIISGETRMVDAMLREKVYETHSANVAALTLNADEITVGCDNRAKNKKCVDDKTKISVATTAVDPENDVLTYKYTISAGKIVGNGANVIWDLSGVKAGTYTITAGVDDSCGVCGRTVTKTVVIKKCSDCVKEKLKSRSRQNFKSGL